MAEVNNIGRERWLIAAWPGMGNVALLAAGYLLEQLPAHKVAELDSREFFNIQSVDVRHGLATPSPLPRNLFFEWNDPAGRHDLLIFAGEAQPATDGFKLCQQVVDYAARHGVKRLFTFAAMATQLQLGTHPRVFAAATNPSLLSQARLHGAQVLDEGRIGGLNGVLLAVGAERGMGGTCLLGELPYFAAGVPNPRAAEVILECFSGLAAIDIDLTVMKQQADVVEEQLGKLLEQLSDAASQAADEGEAGEEETDGGDGEQDRHTTPGKTETERMPRLDPKTERRIEVLFEKARRDRSKSVDLKRELDLLGVFAQYEDRFLDLFRNAE
ncbi:MAG: hypothetical protein JWN51_81 [Phycisphaerales bacterium]|jgi:proteasome assembly chaperone (PAC2) family protein|nr:hypothetical protein [Phycisphaerales bacterium]